MTSRLMQMQARFQQKQMAEKEEKLLKLYENQQQRAFERVGRGSAGSNASVGSGGGKVRQMFDERRQKAGVDKSYPLEPLKSKPKAVSVSQKSTVSRTVSTVRNGKAVSKREVVQSIYNNNNGKETYEEHKFEDDGGYGRRDIVDMMNEHNLNGLDDEEMPKIGFEEAEPYIRGKLANVGGKLPSQANGVRRAENKITLRSDGVDGVKKDKPALALKKTVRAAPPPRLQGSVSPVSTASSKSTSSGHLTPAKAATVQPTKMKSQSTRGISKSAVKSPKQTTVSRDDLAECKYCGRRFALDRLQIHEDICAKTGKKKRKTYDATKHRVMGTELESYVGTKKLPQKMTKQPPKKDWKRTHEEFIAAIRAAKMTQMHLAKGGKLADLPPPPPATNPDYVQCPHCLRRFNEAAAERHIPKCANFLHNKPKPVNSSSSKSKTSRSTLR